MTLNATQATRHVLGGVRAVVYALLDLAWAGWFLFLFLCFHETEPARLNSAMVLLAVEGMAWITPPFLLGALIGLWSQITRTGRKKPTMITGMVFLCIAILASAAWFAWLATRWEGAQWVFPMFFVMVSYKIFGFVTLRLCSGSEFETGAFFKDLLLLEVVLPVICMVSLAVVVEIAVVGGEVTGPFLWIQAGIIYYVLLALRRLSEHRPWRALDPGWRFDPVEAAPSWRGRYMLAAWALPVLLAILVLVNTETWRFSAEDIAAWQATRVENPGKEDFWLNLSAAVIIGMWTLSVLCFMPNFITEPEDSTA